MFKEYPSLNTKPLQHLDSNRGLFARQENGNTVIRCPRSLIILKKFETEIWEMCNGENTIQSIIEYVHLKYKIDRQKIEGILLDFLEGLRTKGLLIYND